jgi:hypothetical protein
MSSTDDDGSGGEAGSDVEAEAGSGGDGGESGSGGDGGEGEAGSGGGSEGGGDGGEGGTGEPVATGEYPGPCTYEYDADADDTNGNILNQEWDADGDGKLDVRSTYTYGCWE